MVVLSAANTQAVVDEYKHVNSQIDPLDLRLNPLQREYYLIKKYEKSYVIHCNYGWFWSTATF